MKARNGLEMLAENLPIIWPNEKTCQTSSFCLHERKPIKRVYRTLRSVYFIFFLQSLAMRVSQRNFKSEVFIAAAFLIISSNNPKCHQIDNLLYSTASFFFQEKLRTIISKSASLLLSVFFSSLEHQWHGTLLGDFWVAGK